MAFNNLVLTSLRDFGVSDCYCAWLSVSHFSLARVMRKDLLGRRFSKGPQTGMLLDVKLAALNSWGRKRINLHKVNPLLFPLICAHSSRSVWTLNELLILTMQELICFTTFSRHCFVIASRLTSNGFTSKKSQKELGMEGSDAYQACFISRRLPATLLKGSQGVTKKTEASNMGCNPIPTYLGVRSHWIASE